MRLFLALLLVTVLPALWLQKPGISVPSVSEQSKPIFSFGIVTDVQYCDCEPSGSRFFRPSLQKLRQAVNSLKANKVDFIINLGDLIEKDFGSYRPVMQILDSSGLKVYHVTGNHDYYVAPKLKKYIPQLQGNKKGFYSFTSHGFRLIFLNGNEVSTFSTQNNKIISAANDMISSLNRMGEPNGLEHNGAIGVDQMIWLGVQLNEAEINSEKVFIFCHYPVWPVNDHNLLNYRQVLDTLGKHRNIKAWFNGHNHPGNYGNVNMIHFITLRAMCETATVNSFSIVEVYFNKIWIKGEGREKSQILAY